MGCSERAGGAALRQRVIGQAAGRTLEIGAGSGFNLPHYTGAVSNLVVTEPSPHMVRLLSKRLSGVESAFGKWELLRAGAEALPFPDGSFDSVTAGYVQCTIPRPELALAEIARVLRRGGRYLFIEHVRARRGSLLGWIQDLVDPIHAFIGAGCHPNRRTEDLLRKSGMAVDWIASANMPAASPLVRPVILGALQKLA